MDEDLYVDGPDKPPHMYTFLLPDTTYIARPNDPMEEERWKWFLSVNKFLHVNRISEGIYAEFGCHQANSFRYALIAPRT